MLKLVITDDEGRTTVCPLDRDEVTIGRGEGNTIRLTERNVSRKHAVLRRASRGCEIEDLRSYNGTKVGGTKITAPRVVRDGERIQIGDYQVTLQSARAPVRVGRDGTKTAQITADAETALFALPDEARTEATQAASRARPSGKPRLVVEAGPGKGKQFVLDRDELTLGQAPECEVRLDHASVSRAHAKIVNVGGVRILDLQSTNGVRVNGRDVPYAELEPGDLIELGEVRLRFVVPGAPARPGASAADGRRTTWLLGGMAAGFVAVALILFVAWPAPTVEPPTPPGGGAPPAPGASPAGSPNDSSSAATAYITVARAHQKKGALREAEEAASKAKAILESRGSPTAVADNVLHDLIQERAARDELERAREQAARSPRDALSSLDRIPSTTYTASDPAVAQIAADALARLLHDIEGRARQERAEARTQVETLLEHPRLVPATLPAELERVRTQARTLQESLSEQAVAVAPGHPPGKRPPGPRENPRENPRPPPDEVRPASNAQETAAFGRLRAAAASNPALACQLARGFLRDFPGSRNAGQARAIVAARCH